MFKTAAGLCAEPGFQVKRLKHREIELLIFSVLGNGVLQRGCLDKTILFHGGIVQQGFNASPLGIEPAVVQFDNVGFGMACADGFRH